VPDPRFGLSRPRFAKRMAAAESLPGKPFLHMLTFSTSSRNRTSSEIMARDIDYYALLGVSREATEAEIRDRFRFLARQAHPDRAPALRRSEAEATMAATAPGDAIANDYLAQGIDAYKEKRYKEAAGNFGLAARREPQDARAQHYLGLAASRAGDMRTAVRALEAAMALDPQNGRLLADAGSVFRQAGLLFKAEKAYQEAVRWEPSASDARKALEEVRAQRADRERSL